MSERKSRPSTDPVYSEADLAEFRLEWERGQREQQWSVQLGTITGRLDAIPEMIRNTARQTTLEVLAEQKQSEKTSRRTDLRLAVAVISVIVLVLVPIETAIVQVVIR